MIHQKCKGLSSPQRCDQVTHLRAPLDSTVIYPITRSLNYHHETGKIEKLSTSYLFLAHNPLELDDDDLDSLKLDHLSWLCMLAHAWWRLLQILPHTSLWESLAKLRLHVSTCTSSSSLDVYDGLVIIYSSRVQHMNSNLFPWTRSIKISQCKH